MLVNVLLLVLEAEHLRVSLIALLLSKPPRLLRPRGDNVEFVEVAHHVAELGLLRLQLCLQLLDLDGHRRVLARQSLITSLNLHKLGIAAHQFHLVDHGRQVLAGSPQRQRDRGPCAASDAPLDSVQRCPFHDGAIHLQQLVAAHADAGARGRSPALHLRNQQAAPFLHRKLHADAVARPAVSVPRRRRLVARATRLHPRRNTRHARRRRGRCHACPGSTPGPKPTRLV